MKANLLSALALVTLAFTSCNNDDIDRLNDRKVNFTSGITAIPQTKVATDNAGNSTWDLNDPIGIYMLKKGTTIISEGAENIPYKAKTAAASTQFDPSGATTIYFPVNINDKSEFITYHPYNSSVTNWVYPVDVSNQASQTGIDLMYATADNSGNGYNKESTNVSFTFEHKLVKLIMNVSHGSGVSGTISSVTITGMNTSAEFDLKGTNGLTNPGTPLDITPYMAIADIKYEAILLPEATLNAAHKVNFTMSGGEIYTWKMSDDISSLDAGNIYTYDVTLTRHAINAVGDITKWTVGSTGTGIAD